MTGLELVSFNDLKPKLGIKYSRTHIDRKEKAGTFPRSFKLGDGRYSRRGLVLERSPRMD
jgi:predicted DNA-binding transcriptional regulator AlpA